MKRTLSFTTIMIIFLLGIGQRALPDQHLIAQAIDQKLHQKPSEGHYTTLVDALDHRGSTQKSPANSIPSTDCYDQTLNVHFICRPEWTIVTEDNGFSLILARDQSAMMTVIKIDQPFKFLYQLNMETLQALGNYAQGFSKEDATFAGETAFKIKAFADTTPPSRLTDYYLMHEGALYRVSFSVQPKERWDEYKFLMQELSNGFGFGKQ